jgi:hypothetical protein
MADVQLYRGGTPEVKFMFCEGDPVRSGPPFGQIGFKKTPPYNAAADGCYIQKDHTLGRPFIPSDDEAVWNKFKAADPQVGEFLQCIVVPVNHYVDAVRFDINSPDPGLAGATVIISAQKVEWDPTAQAFVWTEIPDVVDAAAAQGKDTPIPLDVPSSTAIFLGKVMVDTNVSVSTSVTVDIGNGIGTGSGAGTGTNYGYAVPLYVEPLIVASGNQPNISYVRHESGAIVLGLKILSMPTPGAKAHTFLHQALNDFYMSAKVHGFDCPAS